MTTKVLVIEDNPDIREIISFLAKTNGYEVTAVASAEEALAQPFSCDMVLVLDLMLPDMNGIALVQELERRGLRRMPILVMSASRRQLVQAQEANIGDAYILKGARGFSFHTVMDAIGKLSLQQAS